MNYTLSKGGKPGAPVPLRAGVKRFVPLMTGEGNAVTVSLIAILCSSAATLIAPVIIGHTVDRYIAHRDQHGLLVYSMLLLAVYIAGVIASYIQVRTMGFAGRRLLFRLRNSLFTKLQELPVAFFNQNKAGDLISRLNNDTDKLNQFIAQALMQFVGSAFMMAGAAIFLLTLNIRLGSAALLPAVVALIITRTTGTWVKNRNLKSLQGLGGMSAEVQESLNNFKVIVAFNRLDYFRRKFQTANDVNYAASTAAGIANNLFIPLYGLAGTLAQLAVIGYGIYMIEAGNISVGLLIGFLLYVNSFYQPMRQVAAVWSSFQMGLAALERISVAHRGRLVEMPAGMALAIPTRVGPMVKTPLLSWVGKLRVLGDLSVPKPSGEVHDEAVGSFLKRHFGAEATDRIAGPLLGGIFAGDIDELSILSTFPQLVDLERRHGSLIRAFFAAERARAAQNNQQPKLGAAADDPLYLPEWFEFFRWLYRQGRQGESPFQSLRSGMGQLVEQLVARLPGSCLQLGVALRGLERSANGKWRAHLSNESTLEFDGVILCLPASDAAAVIPEASLAAELSGIPHVRTAAVYFALRVQDLSRPLDASGYMVPRSEGRAFASSWASTKWAGRAPEGSALVRVSLGGARDPALVATSSDDELAQLARQELERMIGPIGHPLFVRTFKHVRPQPIVGHSSRLARIESRLADVPGLLFASSAFGGQGIPDCIRRATTAAETILRHRG